MVDMIQLAKDICFTPYKIMKETKMITKCPKCKQECEGEAPKKPWFYHCECECDFEFAYDDYASI